MTADNSKPVQDAPHAATQAPTETMIHATAVAVGSVAFAIRGRSGAGKSDLALRCLAHPPLPFAKNLAAGECARLVSDDQCLVSPGSDGRLHIRAPDAIAGLLEIRGVGIHQMPHTPTAHLRLLIDLDTAPPERLPDPPWREEHLCGRSIPVADLAGDEIAAATKALILLDRVLENDRT